MTVYPSGLCIGFKPRQHLTAKTCQNSCNYGAWSKLTNPHGPKSQRKISSVILNPLQFQFCDSYVLSKIKYGPLTLHRKQQQHTESVSVYYRCHTEKKVVTLKAVKKPTVDRRFLLRHKCCQIIDSRHIVSSVLQISKALKGNEVCIDQK